MCSVYYQPNPSRRGGPCHGPPAGCALGSVGNFFDRVWPPTTSGYLQATSTVLVTTFSTQNCAQAGSQSTRPLPHMNLNVSERLTQARICALWGLSRSTDRVTGQKNKTVKERRQRTMEEDETLSSSEAPRAPALDSVQGLSIPVAGPEAPFRPTSGMPAAGAAACAGPVGRLRVACIGVCAVSARAG